MSGTLKEEEARELIDGGATEHFTGEVNTNIFLVPTGGQSTLIPEFQY